MRILYVEDEKFLAEAVKHNLEKSGFDVDLAFDGEDGLNAALDNIYDCVVLDVMLPKLSGIDILSRMRERKKSTPVIMLSALSEVEDKVRGLDAGADDYLAKPFKTAELVARINALSRRPAEMQERKISYLDLTYDLDEKQLNGVNLTTKEADIVHELMKTPEKIVKKEYLLNKVWGGDAYGEDNYIEVYMSRLRKVLKKLKSHAKIMTVRGLGYKLVEE
ncbi:MAG: response regulator transcription factor [Candidatus Saccharibacteria bacterium]|nr:response regulator transcription factor [Candidatus Saccharibacteria bacterium]